MLWNIRHASRVALGAAERLKGKARRAAASEILQTHKCPAISAAPDHALSAAVGRKQPLLSTKKIKLAYTLNIHIST
jgi:hypothetical protein